MDQKFIETNSFLLFTDSLKRSMNVLRVKILNSSETYDLSILCAKHECLSFSSEYDSTRSIRSISSFEDSMSRSWQLIYWLAKPHHSWNFDGDGTSELRKECCFRLVCSGHNCLLRNCVAHSKLVFVECYHSADSRVSVCINSISRNQNIVGSVQWHIRVAMMRSCFSS